MALRRETLLAAGLFDEKFRWYRTADIEYSFRVKDLDRRATVVDVPVRSTRIGCGSRRRPRIGRDGRRRTSTGSSTGSATVGTCWSTRYPRTNGRITITTTTTTTRRTSYSVAGIGGAGGIDTARATGVGSAGPSSSRGRAAGPA